MLREEHSILFRSLDIAAYVLQTARICGLRLDIIRMIYRFVFVSMELRWLFMGCDTEHIAGNCLE